MFNRKASQTSLTVQLSTRFTRCCSVVPMVILFSTVIFVKWRYTDLVIKRYAVIPVGIWCQNDVVLTSMQRHHVASTSIRRHFGTKCPLGSFATYFSVSKWLPQAVVRMYTEQAIIDVGCHVLRSFLKINILYKINMNSVQKVYSDCSYQLISQEIYYGKLKDAQG